MYQVSAVYSSSVAKLRRQSLSALSASYLETKPRFEVWLADSFASFPPDRVGESGLDSFLSEPAPNVGWLSAEGEQSPEERMIREHGDPIWGKQEQPESDFIPTKERPFMEKAQEATMATMSVLVGVGMAALPFLIGAL